MDNFNFKNHIYIEGKRHFNSSRCVSRYDELYSNKFKAIWFYVNNNFEKLNIKSIKEFSSVSSQFNDYGEKVNNFNNNNQNNNFIVNQYCSFKLTDHIYCKVEIYDNNLEDKNSKSIVENVINLDIYSYKSLKYINDFLNKILYEYENKLKISRLNKLFIYTLNYETSNYDYDRRNNNHKNYWEELEFNSNKSFHNIFFENKQSFIDKIDFFINNEKYYNKNGIPYTLGIALQGEPGTGKTSIIKCLANYLKRHIVIINLNNIKTNKELDSIFYEDTYSFDNKKGSISFKDKIYVFEDIDCCMNIFKSRKSKKYNHHIDDENINIETDYSSSESDNNERKKIKCKKYLLNDDNKDKLSLGHILNLFDGIKETPGRIIIITSNYMDKIDEALKRPGRIDYILKMDYVNINTFKQIYFHYFNEEINNEDINIINKLNLTPAQVINLFTNFNNKNDLINNFNKLYKNDNNNIN
jgi:ATP-dependent Zn protease